MIPPHGIPIPPYRNEKIFNRGKDAFLTLNVANPYRKCKDYRRGDWEAGYQYKQQIYYKLLAEAEGKDYNS